jgi:signal transduction histidine kinase/ActR/RegA family two-component response regulator
LRNVFAFLQFSGDPQLEHEFRTVYREPSVRYLRIAFLLGFVAFAGFFAMDAMTGRLDAGPPVSRARIGLIVTFGAGVLLINRYRSFVVRFYGPIVNIFCLLGIQATALFPIAVHEKRSSLEFYWSLNTSLVTGIIVIYGFSRLTAKNTALIVFSGCVAGAATALISSFYDPYYFGRLTLHLLIVTIVSYSLRQSVERRERQLFLLAKDNLLKNIYAKELEVAKARAEEADKVKMRFLGNMSHEFRTPMSGVVQTLDVVSRSATGEVAGLVSKAVESSKAFLNTINSILDYTRWSQEELAPKPSSVGLAAAVRRVVARHREAMSRRHLALHLRLDLTDSEDYVSVDEVMLAEVLGNVLGNAVKFTHAGRIDFSVELRRTAGTTESGVSIEVVVTDTGIGIPAEAQPLLGTAFYQVDSGSNRKSEGTGLGLAIVSRLISAMGGSWSVSSVEGRGTTVRLSIPSEIASKPIGARDSRSRTLDFRHRAIEPLAGTVLLVEDNQLNADLAKDLLNALGLEVSFATDGQQAVLALSEASFDIVLMDCQMPVMDGYEATRTIRMQEEERGAPRVPIVAVTANALAGDREKCLEAGMDDHLAKPYTADQLREVLTTWLPQRGGASTPASPAVTAP